ncbi:hypothetical protein RCJ22_29775 [Vibrio sp. FNV 38]|nr:hypothetical protein [Vibrio sp. FNV 38]
MFNLKPNAVMLAVSLFAASSAVSAANNFSYDYIEARSGLSPLTMGLEGSKHLMDNLHFVGRIDSKLDGDWDLAGGLGFNGPINQYTDIFGQMLVHNIREEDSGSTDFKPEVNVGLRVWLTNQLEATGRIGVLKDKTVFHGGIKFHSTETLVLSADIRNNGVYGVQPTLGVRFQF